MSQITSTLRDFFIQCPPLPIVIAYSGGVDSQVLLHALASLKHTEQLSNTLIACHVNHGLSENVLNWETFAAQQCAKLAVDLKVFRVSVKPKAQQSLEAIARDARYGALQKVTDGSSIIITGHHGDDQSETLLLALKRGAGVKGLSAMAQSTSLGRNTLARPLLTISRDEIVNYAKKHHLTWIEDESNTDTSFDRNFIRQQIMPLLKARWPSISHTINRSANHCAEGQHLLNELAQQDLEKCIITETSLKVNELKTFSIARFNNIIRFFLSKHNGSMPSTEQLTQLFLQLDAKADKNPAIKIANSYFRRYKEGLYLTEFFADVSQWHCTVNLNEIALTPVQIELPDNLGHLSFNTTPSNSIQTTIRDGARVGKQLEFTPPLPEQSVKISFSHHNPRCLPDYRQHSRALKKVLQELEIPPWQRQRLPFLYYDNELVAVLGYFVCQQYQAR